MSAASTGAVGEIGEETILPTGETKQCTVLDTCPSVGETELEELCLLLVPLSLNLKQWELVRILEFGTTSALSSVSKYDGEVSLTTQDTEHDMVISTSPSGGSS